MQRWVKWVQRVMLIVFVGSIPVSGGDLQIERLRDSLDMARCARTVAYVDQGRTLEEIDQAYAWNALLPAPIQAINHDYFSPAQVLSMVDAWSPQIACIAGAFDIPPELLAGIVALEMDLDYHVTDAVVDNLLQSPLADLTSEVEIGAGYGGVHFKHLRPALETLGPNFSTAPFYREYYALIHAQSDDKLTILTTRYHLIDLANAAVMARYYAQLRLGKRPMSSLTITDMAFVWSAYRGGVVNTPADPCDNYRWSVDYLQQADNPQLFGDTIIALPYFSYYRARYGTV